jgi:hypothetical protein
MTPKATELHEATIEMEQKQTRARRTRPLPAMARKLAQSAKLLAETALREEERNLADHERLVKLFRLAFRGIEKTMEGHPSFTDEDKEVLRTAFGFKC